ncbi:hypothetical protein [Alkaliphilus crotonatoxidans]
MTIVYLFLIGLVLLSIDYPLLKGNKSKTLKFLYGFLLIIGLGINYIVIKRLPIDSPSVIFERIIMSFIER